jgi:predicted dienelactone hydrolase
MRHSVRFQLCAAMVVLWCGSPTAEDRDASTTDGGVVDAAMSNDAATTEDDGGAAVDSAIAGDAAVDRPCSPDALEACAYDPGVRFDEAPISIVPLSYVDESGAERAFEIAVHRPDGATAPMPVVVWSHGGADGIMRANGVGADWARAFTSAGYVVIAIAHFGRDMASRAALCASLGVEPAACATFNYLFWDRPHDLEVVLDWLEDATGPLAGMIDLDRLAYAGHSAGAGNVLMTAGASRDYAGTVRTFVDPRPRAFIACSPQAPGADGFVLDSFDAIERPTLSLTGVGDDTAVVAEDRRLPFERMMPGEKYLGWITDESARHTMFELGLEGCERYAADEGLDPARCTRFRPWLVSAALAFLDAQLRDDAEARAYLASDDLEVLSGGEMEWSRR